MSIGFDMPEISDSEKIVLLNKEVVLLRKEIEKIKEKKLVEPANKEEVYKKLELINKIACQRFQWPRDSNEDNAGWLEIGNISAEALVGKVGKK